MGTYSVISGNLNFLKIILLCQVLVVAWGSFIATQGFKLWHTSSVVEACGL